MTYRLYYVRVLNLFSPSHKSNYKPAIGNLPSYKYNKNKLYRYIKKALNLFNINFLNVIKLILGTMSTV